jgi:hypothetical protein
MVVIQSSFQVPAASGRPVSGRPLARGDGFSP